MNTCRLGIQILPALKSCQRPNLILDIEKYLWKGIPMVKAINVNGRSFKKKVRAEISYHRVREAYKRMLEAGNYCLLEESYYAGFGARKQKIKESEDLTRNHIVFCGKCDHLIHWQPCHWPRFEDCFGFTCNKCDSTSCLTGKEAAFIEHFDENPLYYCD